MRNYLYLLLIWSAGVRAEVVIFSAADAPRVEYRAAVESDPEAETPVEAWRAQYSKSSPRREFHESLVKRFERGQKAYLNFNLEDARREFNILVEDGHREDLTRAEREIVVTSLLRLAQMEGESSASETWLLRSLNYLADVPIDRKIFPPPLLARLQKLRLETKRGRPHTILNDLDWSVILINGQACTVRDCPDFFMTSEPVRFTFLSDRFLPQTVVARLDAADDMSPKKLPWFTGACSHPNFHSRARALGQPRAFWNLACEQSSPDHLSSVKEVKSHDLKLSEVAPSPTASRDLLDGSERSGVPQLAEPAPHRGGWLRSKWFWLGVGSAVVTGAVLVSQSHPREHIEATSGD